MLALNDNLISQEYYRPIECTPEHPCLYCRRVAAGLVGFTPIPTSLPETISTPLPETVPDSVIPPTDVGEQTYTQVPNWILDDVLPDLSNAERCVLLFIVRKITGFHKESDRIALTQFTGYTDKHGVHHKGCGITSRKAVSRAIAHLEGLGIISVKHGKASCRLMNTYTLVLTRP